ncbi:winged helix-turn-helix transcriptional regulator [Streptomyces sp. YIM 98790]|uniref:winged helix-turn-helix transcriptional regulator n=1 Tax=Streptomyces sp. YIM 98790 TaxID=2689077 RepID=UPI00140BF9E5|nr:winged helix-turn-helix transcriptional regulator [Streptomyces sp. YIM 98790]
MLLPLPAFPRATAADLSRVEESLEMLAPRWAVWTLMSMGAQPLRYREVKDRLPWLADGQLSPRLRQLVDDGLAERLEPQTRHSCYRLTDRAHALGGVLNTLAQWAQDHLEKETGPDGNPRPVARAQDIEDTLALLSPKNAPAVLWALRAHGCARGSELAALITPHHTSTAIYQPIRQLTEAGLIRRAPTGQGFQLTGAGHDLAPVWAAISAWAAGRPTDPAPDHPLWTHQPAPAPAAPGAWTTHRTSNPAPAGPPPTAPEQLRPAWRPGDLFSHAAPARPVPAAARVGRTR